MSACAIAPASASGYAFLVSSPSPPHQGAFPEVIVSLAPGRMSKTMFEAWEAFVLCHLPKDVEGLSLRGVTRMREGQAGSDMVGCEDDELAARVERWLWREGWERFTFEVAFGLWQVEYS